MPSQLSTAWRDLQIGVASGKSACYHPFLDAKFPSTLVSDGMPVSQGTEESEMAERSVLENGLKLIGEVAVLPGSGLLLEGQVVNGLLHTGTAYLAGMAIGPIGWILVVADSYAQATTGRPLWDQRLRGTLSDAEAAPVEERTPPTPTRASSKA
jgi:hypothetical protein